MKTGGNIALKRQKMAEKVLKANKGGVRQQLEKAWLEDIRGEKRQIFGSLFYMFALKEGHFVDVETETEPGKITLKVDKLFNNDYTLNKIDFDVSEIKQKFAEWKAEQKQKDKKHRDPHCLIEIGNAIYNAEYFLNCIEVMGADAEFYQNENTMGLSFFVSECGEALILPCKPPARQ